MRVTNIAEGEEDEIYVIDDLLLNPHVLRRQGLEASYPVPPQQQWYPGLNSAKAYPIPELDEAMTVITGEAVKPFERNVHGFFRLCLEGHTGKGGVHIDRSHWTGIFFLTLDKHAQGGTDFFRHRATGTLRAPVYPEDWDQWHVKAPDDLWAQVIRPETNDVTKWERVRHVPMKFNRCVLFRSQRKSRLRRLRRQRPVDLCVVVQIGVSGDASSRRYASQANYDGFVSN